MIEIKLRATYSHGAKHTVANMPPNFGELVAMCVRETVGWPFYELPLIHPSIEVTEEFHQRVVWKNGEPV